MVYCNTLKMLQTSLIFNLIYLVAWTLSSVDGSSILTHPNKSQNIVSGDIDYYENELNSVDLSVSEETYDIEDLDDDMAHLAQAALKNRSRRSLPFGFGLSEKSNNAEVDDKSLLKYSRNSNINLNIPNIFSNNNLKPLKNIVNSSAGYVSKQASNVKNVIKSNPVVNLFNPFKWKNIVSNNINKLSKSLTESDKVISLNPNGIITGKNEWENTRINKDIWETDNSKEILIQKNEPGIKESGSVKRILFEFETESNRENSMKKDILDLSKQASNVKNVMEGNQIVNLLNPFKWKNIVSSSVKKITEIPQKIGTFKSLIQNNYVSGGDEWNKIKSHDDNSEIDAKKKILVKKVVPTSEDLNSVKNPDLEIENKDKNKQKQKDASIVNIISQNMNNKVIERLTDGRDAIFSKTVKNNDIFSLAKSGQGTVGLIMENMKKIGEIVPNPFPKNVYLNMPVNLAAFQGMQMNEANQGNIPDMDARTYTWQESKEDEEKSIINGESNSEVTKPVVKQVGAHETGPLTATTKDDESISETNSSDIIEDEMQNISRENSFEDIGNITDDDIRSKDNSNLKFRMRHSDSSELQLVNSSHHVHNSNENSNLMFQKRISDSSDLQRINITNPNLSSNNSNSLIFRGKYSNSNDLERKILVDFYRDLYLPSRIKQSSNTKTNKRINQESLVSSHNRHQKHSLKESEESTESEEDADITELYRKQEKDNPYGNEGPKIIVTPIRKEIIYKMENKEQKHKLKNVKGTYDSMERIEDVTYAKKIPRKIVAGEEASKNFLNTEQNMQEQINEQRKEIDTTTLQNNNAIIIKNENTQKENNFNLNGETKDEEVNRLKYIALEPKIKSKEKTKYLDDMNKSIDLTSENAGGKHKHLGFTYNHKKNLRNSSQMPSVSLKKAVYVDDRGKIKTSTDNMSLPILQEKSSSLEDSKAVASQKKSVNNDLKYKYFGKPEKKNLESAINDNFKLENGSHYISTKPPVVLKRMVDEEKNTKITPAINAINSSMEQKIIPLNVFHISQDLTLDKAPMLQSEHTKNKSVVETDTKSPEIQKKFVKIVIFPKVRIDTDFFREKQKNSKTDEMERNKILLSQDISSKTDILEHDSHKILKELINISASQNPDFKTQPKSLSNELKLSSQLSKAQKVLSEKFLPVIHIVRPPKDKLDSILRQIIRLAFIMLTSEKKEQWDLDIYDDLEQLLGTLKVKAKGFNDKLFQYIKIKDDSETLVLESQECGINTLTSKEIDPLRSDIKMLGQHLQLAMKYYIPLNQPHQDAFSEKLGQMDVISSFVPQKAISNPANLTEDGRKLLQKKGQKSLLAQLWEKLKSLHSASRNRL